MKEVIKFFIKFYFLFSTNIFIYGSTKNQILCLGNLKDINMDFLEFDIKFKQRFNINCSKKYIIFYEEL